ncbi:gliding motility lipoprotein GldD [Runella sp.]|jgi:gliding motility-associated lipoprotein GldD|uniref:gliding motility lipoprotein GldD n=1 Tax=Runella sp. TaxID=1960881 RepID=UPI002631E070|nr:gliding motility lipoprotein GldD [Runella sp.]
MDFELEVRSQKSVVKSWDLEVRSRRYEVGSQILLPAVRWVAAYYKQLTVNRKPQTVYFLLFTFSCLLFTACSSTEPDYFPKPKGYPRMDLPPQEYQTMKDVHPYSFEYSKSAVLLPDTFSKSEPHWIFVAYPSLKASIQLTYKPVQNNPQRLSGFINDAYKLAGKHQVRATGIREQVIKTKSGRTVVLFELAGDVPSYIQFFTTDTTTHYLRGALYFTVADKQDSLQPAINYLRKDVMHMLNTLKWKK